MLVLAPFISVHVSQDPDQLRNTRKKLKWMSTQVVNIFLEALKDRFYGRACDQIMYSALAGNVILS